jgi:hypothetical protein
MAVVYVLGKKTTSGYKILLNHCWFFLKKRGFFGEDRKLKLVASYDSPRTHWNHWNQWNFIVYGSGLCA